MYVLDSPMVDRTARSGTAERPPLPGYASARLAAQREWRTDLVARSRRQIAISRELLAQPVRCAFFEPASAGARRPGPVERSARHRTWDGRPDAPARSGWHWVEDGEGLLRPMLWRGADWPDPRRRDTWQDGDTALAPSALSRGRCLGPLAVPPGVAAQLRTRLAAGAG